MRSVTYSMGVSLDGYIAGPDGDITAPPPDEEVFRFVPTRYDRSASTMNIDTTADAEVWLSGADAKTSLLILES